MYKRNTSIQYLLLFLHLNNTLLNSLIMKKNILLFAFILFHTLLFAQDVEISGVTIENTLTTGTGGKFIVTNDDVANPAKLEIFQTGEVNWFLNKQDFFIRDGNFEAYDGVFTSYDFIHIDGTNGRIGFNVLSDKDGSVYNELPLTSSVHLNGSIATRVRTLDGTDSYELKQDDHTVIVNLNNSNVTMDLPPVANAKGRSYRIKRDALAGNNNRLILDADGTEKIDNALTYEVSKNLGVVEIVCDGTQWWILSAEDQLAYYVQASSSAALDTSKHINAFNFSSSSETLVVTLPGSVDIEGEIYTIKRNKSKT